MEKPTIQKKTYDKDEKVHLRAISIESKAKEYAYNAGKRIAQKCIKCASSQEILDALPRPNSHHDTNYFALIRNIYFSSIEKIFPDETNDFKFFHNVDFMKGWREEVILLWDTKQKKNVY